jgi:dolichyl-phosphate beta-glucosyltransferase
VSSVEHDGFRADRRLCLVVPCYNEAKRLNVAAFRAFVQCEPHTRLLFVDDGSRDGTLEVLQRVRAGCEDRVEVVARGRNQGKAEAVRHGILYALDRFCPEYVGFWDADLATPLGAVLPFVGVLDKDASKDMVFGARVKLLGRFVERRAIRHYLGRVFATVVSNILRLAIYDTQCGAKIFRVTDVTRGVFDQPFLSKWVFDVEIIARYLNAYRRDVQRLERAIYEYPLEVWMDVAGSKVKPTDFFAALYDVLRIKLRYLR